VEVYVHIKFNNKTYQTCRAPVALCGDKGTDVVLTPDGEACKLLGCICAKNSKGSSTRFPEAAQFSIPPTKRCSVWLFCVRVYVCSVLLYTIADTMYVLTS
jgi:hypothetical protein